MDEKKLGAVSTIQRALGIMEGLACGLPEDTQPFVYDAVEMIDQSLEVLLK